MTTPKKTGPGPAPRAPHGFGLLLTSQEVGTESIDQKTPDGIGGAAIFQGLPYACHRVLADAFASGLADPYLLSGIISTYTGRPTHPLLAIFTAIRSAIFLRSLSSVGSPENAKKVADTITKTLDSISAAYRLSPGYQSLLSWGAIHGLERALFQAAHAEIERYLDADIFRKLDETKTQ